VIAIYIKFAGSKGRMNPVVSAHNRWRAVLPLGKFESIAMEQGFRERIHPLRANIQRLNQYSLSPPSQSPTTIHQQLGDPSAYNERYIGKIERSNLTFSNY